MSGSRDGGNNGSDICPWSPAVPADKIIAVFDVRTSPMIGEPAVVLTG
ncbi:MAG: hypothetical protein NTX54_03795 [Chloroflexi bacterium]|nr:hypothetical protein [Chloroflexota bacterium]